LTNGTRKPGVGPQLRVIEDVHERLRLTCAEIAAPAERMMEGKRTAWRVYDVAISP